MDLPTLSWTGSQILRGAPVVISNVDELLKEPQRTQGSLISVSTRSFIAFPLRSDGRSFTL